MAYDYTKPYGTPNAPGQGYGTPGASQSSSVANAIMQKKPPGGDANDAILQSAQAWGQMRKRPGGKPGTGNVPNKPQAMPNAPGQAYPGGPGGPQIALPPGYQLGGSGWGISPAQMDQIQSQYMVGVVGPNGQVTGVPPGWQPGQPLPKPPGYGGGYDGSGINPGAGYGGPQFGNAGGYQAGGGEVPGQIGGQAPPLDFLEKKMKSKQRPGGGKFATNGIGTPGPGGVSDGRAVMLEGMQALGGIDPQFMAAAAKDNAPDDEVKDGSEPGTNPGPNNKPPTNQNPNTNPNGNPNPNQQPKMDQWLIDESNRLAATPGFEFLKSPAGQQIYAMYAARQQQDGTVGKGMTFAEWAAKNWEEAAGKVGMSPEDQKNFGHFVRQTGYKQQAQRMVDEYTKGGGKGDTSWVNGDVVREFEEWARGNPKAGLDFWTWAGTVRRGINPWDNGKPLNPKKPGGPNTGKPLPKPLQDLKNEGGWPAGKPRPFVGDLPQNRPSADADGGGGQTTPGTGAGGGTSKTGGGGGSSTTTAGGGVEGDPEGAYLRKLETAMKERQKYVMGEADRAFQAQAALKGLGNTGAYGDAYGDFMANMGSQFNEQLAKPVWEAYEQEQTRRNNAAMSRYQSDKSWDASRYGADRGLEGAIASANAAHAAAGAAAAAQQYNAQLDYNLGLQQLGLEASNSDWGRQRWMLEMMASLGPEQLLASLFGSGNNYLPGFAWQPGSNGGR